MQRGLGGPVYEPVQERLAKRERFDDQERVGNQDRWEPLVQRDKEITLGTGSLVILGFALFALCALCFGAGYSMGHRSSNDPVEAVTTISAKPTATAPPGAMQVKPSAAQNSLQSQSTAASKAAPDAENSSSEAGAPDANSVAVPVAGAQERTDASAAPAEAVRTALPAQPAAVQTLPAAGHVEPAIGQSSFLVQIAAVSHAEDADVLVGALRKRGYAVSARRDPADGLLYVQVGPFATRSDALTMRQRLLNDGYNAIVQ
jgi:cell division septation protein DedD